MPFALIFVGAILLVAGARGTQDDLFALVKGDFQNNGNQKSFLYWIISILLIGSLGYIERIRPLSRAFLVLVLVVLFIKNGGVFQNINKQLFTTQGAN